MKNKRGLKLLGCIAVYAVCIAISFIYKGIVHSGFGISFNFFQDTAVPVLCFILGTVINVRFIITKKIEKNTLHRCADFISSLAFALAAASLIASPLAATADYIGYAALFGVIFGVSALLPTVLSAEKYAEKAQNDKPTLYSAIITLLLSVVPAVGVYASLCGFAFTTTALRGVIAKNKGIAFLALNTISLLISVVASILFVLLLL